MRDELSHIRNQADAHRRRIMAAHEQYMHSVFEKHPDIKNNHGQIEQAKKAIITMTLAKYRGQALASEVNQLEQQLDELRQQRAALLSKNGIDPQSLEPQWECVRCQDTGMVYINDQYSPCQCQWAKKKEIMRTAAALPSRLTIASFDKANFYLYQTQYRSQAKKIFQYVQSYCDSISNNRGQGLFIHGPTGSGKSYLLGCVANYLCGKISVKYLVYADFLDKLRATYNSRDNEYSEQQMIDQVKNVGLLLLDDLGVEKPTEFSLKNLAQIIDYRYRNCLPLVVTSNFTLEELIRRSQADLYGERIVWRLSESCSNMLELKGNLRLNL